MKIIINGAEAKVTTGLTVSDLLSEWKVKMPDMVSVELNGDILDRHTFQTTTLKEGDKIEFLYFMGGGSGISISCIVIPDLTRPSQPEALLRRSRLGNPEKNDTGFPLLRE